MRGAVTAVSSARPAAQLQLISRHERAVYVFVILYLSVWIRRFILVLPFVLLVVFAVSLSVCCFDYTTRSRCRLCWERGAEGGMAPGAAG